MKRKTNLIGLTAGAVAVAVLLCVFLLTPKRDFSSAENRSLKGKPQFSLSNLMSGRYTAELGEYISDQFPARDTFVTVKAYGELLLGKRENNGVIYAKNAVLIPKTQLGDRLSDNLSTVKEFENAVNIPIYLGVLPSSMDVFDENLPDSYSTKQNENAWQSLFTQAEKLNLKNVNLYDELCEQNNYYRTDHHYTSLGAYQAYSILGEAMGYEPLDMDYFTPETVSRDFCGTSMRTSGFYLAPKDEITLFRYEGDTDYTVTADGKSIALYDFSCLETTDKYAVFLGGNHARVDISTGEDRPKMLVIRDSFADSIAPFLALHYDLVMLDLRYYNDNVQQLVRKEKFDSVLIFQNITEFSSSKNLSYLRMAAVE